LTEQAVPKHKRANGGWTKDLNGVVPSCGRQRKHRWSYETASRNQTCANLGASCLLQDSFTQWRSHRFIDDSSERIQCDHNQGAISGLTRLNSRRSNHRIGVTRDGLTGMKLSALPWV